MPGSIKFTKVATNDEQRLVFGIASMAVTADGDVVTDFHGDQIDPVELESAFYDYVMSSGEGDAMHDEIPASKLVEAFYATPEKLDALFKALGVTADVSLFKGAAAWVGYKVFADQVWKRVKEGELRAFSIEGVAERVEASA